MSKYVTPFVYAGAVGPQVRGLNGYLLPGATLLKSSAQVALQPPWAFSATESVGTSGIFSGTGVQLTQASFSIIKVSAVRMGLIYIQGVVNVPNIYYLDTLFDLSPGGLGYPIVAYEVRKHDTVFQVLMG